MIRRIRLLGITVLTIETDDPKPEPAPGPAEHTTYGTAVGFVADDLPTDHRRGW